jgi:hypothetical protein
MTKIEEKFARARALNDAVFDIETKLDDRRAPADGLQALRQIMKEFRAELDALKLTADPDKWKAVHEGLDLFEDFAHSMFASVLRAIDAARGFNKSPDARCLP